MHAVVSNLIDQTVARFSLQNFDMGALWAAAVGAVLGLVVLGILAAYPGERSLDVDGRPLIAENSGPSTASKSMETRMGEESIPAMQVANLMVYLLLFSACIYYLDRDYDGIVTKWFLQTFPREAETLGLGGEL